MNFDYYFGFSFSNYDSLEVLFQKYHPDNFYYMSLPFRDSFKPHFKHNLYDTFNFNFNLYFYSAHIHCLYIAREKNVP